MKHLIISLLMLLTATGVSYAFIDSYVLDRDNLPQEAQEMLDTYFPKAKIGMIKIDRHLLKKTDYEVRLVNGTTIKFSNAGKWKSVNCKKREVPEELISKTIRNYVKKNYSDVSIVSINKKSSGYEIGLSDGVELKFNLLGGFKSAKIKDE